MTKESEVGDKVLIRFVGEEADPQWQFVQLIRTDKLLILALILFVILIIFGRIKGIQILISICFTCCAVFTFFVPSILSGINIYFSAVLVCVYAIIMTFLIVNGFHRKTLCAMIGALCAIAASGLLSLLMNKIMSMSGYLDESSLELTYLAMDKPISLRAILFAAVLIGALGVIMDVSMSIASSMWELRESSETADFRALFSSGLNIGRDITGTMANTLILAYIGGSLTEVLLLVTANTSLPYLLNREVVIAEILQTLIGVFSILFAIPLTAFICAVLYTEKGKRSAR
ncbi:MAG: YibE/F family protein [Oscillospiraceae bacterium]|nr:YibE/F family protein [Oscillospiraceae bacterium]